MAANPIKEKRLSEDSTASSEASVSASIESADGSGVNTDDSSPSGGSGSTPIKTKEEDLAAEEEEKYVTWLESDPIIAGRYTNVDPNYANDKERLTPPLVLDYNPRVYNRGGRGRGGGRPDNFQNRGRQGHGNYGQSSSYDHQPNQRQHTHHNQQGHHGHYPQQRQPEQPRYPEKRKMEYGELPSGPPRKRPVPSAPSYQSEESD